MVRERQEADAAVRYFNRSNGAQGPGCEEMFDDISATVYRAPDGGAAQVRVSTGTFGPEPALARTVFHSFLNASSAGKTARMES